MSEEPYHVFRATLTDADRERLRPHLSGWKHLNEILVLNGIPVEDIERLLMIEMEGQQRQFIIRKLVGRIKSKERKQLLNYITSCLNQNSKPRYGSGARKKVSSSTSSRRRVAAASRTDS